VRQRAPSVDMPKTSMHEDHLFFRSEHYVGAPWEAAVINAKAITQRIDGLADANLRPSISTLDGTHDP